VTTKSSRIVAAALKVIAESDGHPLNSGNVWPKAIRNVIAS
jgi:hypothetical protein